MILTLGALVALHARWLRGPAPGAVPFALVSGAGVSALGVAFGAWVLAAVARARRDRDRPDRGGPPERAPARSRCRAVGAVIALIAALADMDRRFRVTAGGAEHRLDHQPGQPAHTAARPCRSSATWLVGSYKHVPTGGAARRSPMCSSRVAFLAAVLGALHLLRTRRYALGGWIALMLAGGLRSTAYGTTWADAQDPDAHLARRSCCWPGAA